MLKRPRRELFKLEDLEGDSETDEDSDLKKPKSIKYSKILEEETDFWPEQNIS